MYCALIFKGELVALGIPEEETSQQSQGPETERDCLMTKGQTRQPDIPILSVYAPRHRAAANARGRGGRNRQIYDPTWRLAKGTGTGSVWRPCHQPARPVRILAGGAQRGAAFLGLPAGRVRALGSSLWGSRAVTDPGPWSHAPCVFISRVSLVRRAN